MNNTQEDQQGVDTQALHTVNDATDKSIDVAINSATWFFGPDPKTPFHYQITTPHEPGCGVINVGTFPNLPMARHACKLHNDWLQFKQNKKVKKQDKLLENLKSDFALFKKGFEVLQDGWFDLNYLGVKTFWKTNEDSKNAILAYIRGNKERVEHYLFLLWFKKHVDEFDRMISHVSDGAKAVDILNHFSDVTLFDTKIGSSPRDRDIWDARLWYLTKKELKDTLEDWFDCDTESVLLPEFNGDGKCEVLGLALMDSMYSAVDDWVERVKKMSIAEHIAACNPQKVARVFNAAAERYNEGVNGYVTEKNKVDGGAWGGMMEGNKPLKLTHDVDSITIPLNKHPVKAPTTCMRGKCCKDGCEFYDRGFCRGVVYPTYPPKYKRCDFENNGNAGQEYFTDEEINGFRGETNEPNRPGTNWKVGEPMPTPELDDYQIKELIRKYGERMKVEDEDGESRIYRRLELKDPVHEPKFTGLNPVYDVLALRCPEEEDEETCLFEMECKVVCPPSPVLVVLSNDGLMIDSQLDLAAEVKSTVENLVKLSGRQVGKSSVNADASRELAKTLLGEGVVKEADEKVKEFLGEDGVEQILVIKINDKDAIEYFAGLEEDYDLTKLKFAFRSEGQGNGGSYRYYDTSDVVEVYAETITFMVGNSTANKLGMDGKFKENYQKLFEVAMNNPRVNDLFDHICGHALLKPVQPINGIAINLTPGSVDTMLRQKTTATYDNFKEWEKAHENHENPVYDAECKIDHTVPPETDEQPVDRSGAHKPLTVTKNTIKERPQTYYVERSVKDIVAHLHDDEKIRAVVCFNSRLMSYMPPTNNKTITIVNFMGHTKSMAELYKQWMIPEGKQVEEFLSHDWWYDQKHKCWTYVCNIGCENDPFKFMTLTPVLWDNHTYLGKDKDYKEAPFKYTDG